MSEQKITASEVAAQQTVPVLLDVDTGVDDACALLLAACHDGLDVRGVSCVAGNTDVDQVVANTLTVLAAAGRTDIPVARGADRPLLASARDARHVHGDDGMGDLGWPPARTAPDRRSAVELLRDVLLTAAAAGERITLIPLAPLTNIALLLRGYPQVAAGLRRIVFMGGSAGPGNVTAAAEFNVHHDPEAAAITLRAAADLGIEVTMYGLDVFNQVRVSRPEAAALAASGGSAARLGAALVGAACDRFGGESATLGDAGAVCAVIEPAGLGTRRLPVRVELAGAWTRGQTLVDQRPHALDGEHDPHGPAGTWGTWVDVGLTVDGPGYAGLWIRTLAGAP